MFRHFLIIATIAAASPAPGLIPNLLPDSTPVERQTALLLRTVVP